MLPMVRVIGETDEELLLAIRFVMDFSNSQYSRSDVKYWMTNEEGLLFLRYDTDGNAHQYLIPPTPEEVARAASAWLRSDEAKTIQEPDDYLMNDWGDGTTKLAWEVEHNWGGSLNSTDGKYSGVHSCVIRVRPAWTYYGK